MGMAYGRCSKWQVQSAKRIVHVHRATCIVHVHVHRASLPSAWCFTGLQGLPQAVEPAVAAELGGRHQQRGKESLEQLRPQLGRARLRGRGRGGRRAAAAAPATLQPCNHATACVHALGRAILQLHARARGRTSWHAPGLQALCGHLARSASSNPSPSPNPNPHPKQERFVEP